MEIVFRFSESPIETVFLNSLSLSFINLGMPLVFTGPKRDVKRELARFREHLEKLSEFTSWYAKRGKDDADMEQYLDQEVRRGRMSLEERPFVGRLILYYHWLPFRDAWHITPQAAFPEIEIDGASVRVDALAWNPARPDCMVAIECDGFQFHSSHEAFIRDRRKDRALKASGIEVHRFSGSEIVHDPPGSANSLADYLLSKKRDA